MCRNGTALGERTKKMQNAEQSENRNTIREDAKQNASAPKEQAPSKVVRGERKNQKTKILQLKKILEEYTDEAHELTAEELSKMLKDRDVTAERKSVCDDIHKINDSDVGIYIERSQHDRSYYYRVTERTFELVELKLLVDSIQSAKFITEEKSRQLIEKLESFASRYDRQKMNHHINVGGKVKTENTSVYYSLDIINEAISNNKRICFHYYVWNLNGELEEKHKDKIYEVSPYALCCDDEKYYLVAFDHEAGFEKHFRVDKMKETYLSEKDRQVDEEYIKNRIPEYTERLFGMFDGKEARVTLRCQNGNANVIYDRFGRDIGVVKDGPDHFKTVVKVALSNMFYGWVASIDGVEILAPEKAVNDMKRMIERLRKTYLQ